MKQPQAITMTSVSHIVLDMGIALLRCFSCARMNAILCVLYQWNKLVLLKNSVLENNDIG